MYITPRELAEAVGLGRSTIQRWVDGGAIAAERTAGGHRRIPLAEAARFIRASHLSLKDPAALGLSDLTAPAIAGGEAEPAVQLENLLIDGDGPAFRGLLLTRFLRGESIASMFDTAVTPAMQRIGRLWPEDPRSIIVEHRATEMCIEAISQVRSLLPAPDAAPRRAVGGAYPGDPFALPTLMAATVVAAEGWSESNLGPNTPLDSLALAAEDAGARLAWLSASVIDRHATFDADVARLAGRLAELGATLVVGGRAVPIGWRPKRANVRLMATMRELAAFAHGLKAGAADR